MGMNHAFLRRLPRSSNRSGRTLGSPGSSGHSGRTPRSPGSSSRPERRSAPPRRDLVMITYKIRAKMQVCTKLLD